MWGSWCEFWDASQEFFYFHIIGFSWIIWKSILWFCVKKAATQWKDKASINCAFNEVDMIMMWRSLRHFFSSCFSYFYRLYCVRVIYVWFMWTLCIRKRDVLHHKIFAPAEILWFRYNYLVCGRKGISPLGCKTHRLSNELLLNFHFFFDFVVVFHFFFFSFFFFAYENTQHPLPCGCRIYHSHVSSLWMNYQILCEKVSL